MVYSCIRKSEPVCYILPGGTDTVGTTGEIVRGGGGGLSIANFLLA